LEWLDLKTQNMDKYFKLNELFGIVHIIRFDLTVSFRPVDFEDYEILINKI
jgi:hypothetical protein